MKRPYLPEQYLLSPRAGTTGKLTPVIDGMDEALLPERRKLYVVSAGKEIWYVGEAHCSMQQRMQRGFAAYRHTKKEGKKRGGYGGYKWIEEFAKRKAASVQVFVFDKKYDDNRDAIEAIEAELVFLIRSRRGAWPKYQNKIHFHNSPAARKMALRIYAEVAKAMG